MEENYLKGNQGRDNSNLLFVNLGGGRRLCDAQIIVEGENAVANGHLNVSLSPRQQIFQVFSYISLTWGADSKILETLEPDFCKSEARRSFPLCTICWGSGSASGDPATRCNHTGRTLPLQLYFHLFHQSINIEHFLKAKYFCAIWSISNLHIMKRILIFENLLLAQ